MESSKKILLSTIAIAIVIVLLSGVTFAFFNYTRTGASNVIKTGRIYFNSEQGTAINLTNLFPIDPTETGIMNDATKVGTVTINVTGDTTYGDGIEYLVSAVNVINTVGSGANAKALPISIDVSVTSNTGNSPSTTLGTADSSYFTNRGPSANTSIYKVLAGDTITNNEQLLVGYIKSGATGVDGNIVIRAYIDKAKIAISDTYPEQTIYTVKTTGYSSSACETVLAGVTNASTHCASASSLQTVIDNNSLTSERITSLVNAGIVEEYTDGTTSSWVAGRTVFTTSEWNSLQTNGVSFQVKVEANEGTWVQRPTAAEVIGALPELEDVAGAKRYVGASPANYVKFDCSDPSDATTCEDWRIIGVYGDKLKVVKENPIVDQVYNNSQSDGNVWGTSHLGTYLNQETNGGYFYTLNEDAKGMIVAGLYNTGETSEHANANEASTSSQSSSWTGKIGLISTYEYLYASGSSCREIDGNSFTSDCKQNNWLKAILVRDTGFDYSIKSYYAWTLNMYPEYSQRIMIIHSSGYVNSGWVDASGSNYVSYVASPVVYLNSNVMIDSGTGASNDPYVLSYTAS